MRAFAISGASGAELHRMEIPPGLQPNVRIAVDASGDVDGDGVRDVALGSRKAQRVQVHSGVDGALLYAIDETISDNNSVFGDSVSIAGDLDGDGLADLAIGAPSFFQIWFDGKLSVVRSGDGRMILDRVGTGSLGDAVAIVERPGRRRSRRP